MDWRSATAMLHMLSIETKNGKLGKSNWKHTRFTLD